MISAFVGVNGFWGLRLSGRPLNGRDLAVSWAVAFCFFLRLRCYDEVKDYQVDLKVNPGRPLARGLLQVSEIKRLTWFLVGLELLLVSLVFPQALVCHLVAIGYSLLMYREFFIGRHLRPHLTTYALTHTFVSALLGASVSMQLGGTALLPLALANWPFFNFFEFARKTFAPAEERDNVDSYSSLFRPWGAAALSLSQLLLGWALIFLLAPDFYHPMARGGLLLVVVLELLASAWYVVHPEIKAAKGFRTISSLCLVGSYVFLLGGML